MFNERAFSLSVRLAIETVDIGEAQLEFGILISDLWIGSKAIAKRQALAPELTKVRHQVEMVRTKGRTGLTEPVHHVGTVR